jgi:hypothetical protein
MYHFRHEIERLFFDAFGHVQDDVLWCQERRDRSDKTPHHMGGDGEHDDLGSRDRALQVGLDGY